MKFVSVLVVALACGFVSAADGWKFSRRAGAVWQDGAFVGNGSHGVLAFAPSHFEWVINKNDLFDRRVAPCAYTPHRDVMEHLRTNAVKSVDYLKSERREMPGGGNHLTSSVSAAILRVRFWDGVGWSAPAVPLAEETLDLADGSLSSRMEAAALRPRSVTIVPRDPDVVAIRLSDALSPSRRAVVELSRPEDFRLADAPGFERDGAVVSFVQKLPFGDSYAVAMYVADGDCEIRRGLARVKASGPRDVFLAVRTERGCADPRAAAVAAVKAAAAKSFDALAESNAAWWRDFWARGARAEFASEPEVDLKWRLAMFQLAAQFGPAPMPALNGLVYGPLDGGEAGVGSNCYVHDQNVQIPLMPFFPLNHPEAVRTFAATYAAVMPELERRTRELFGVKGAYLPLNMNADGREHPIGHYRYTLCGGAYSGLILAQAWKYSRDRELLREIYPVLKKFILFYTETMTRDAQGGCHFVWSVPPEIFTGTQDELCIVACLKPCLETAVEAAALFGCDQAEAALWRDVLAHYPAPARHSSGAWWGGPEIPDDHYMYGGHLFYPFFPAESFLDRAAAERTLGYTLTNAVETAWTTPEPHPDHEWSGFYTGVARLRLHGGADGWKAMKDFLGWFAKPNGLFCHNAVIVTDVTPEQARAYVKRIPPRMLRGADGIVREFGRGYGMDLSPNPDAKRLVAPVLEGGAAFLMLATETLLQSWGGEIRIFPAVPENFTGRFDNFRAQGGFLVSAAMANGKVVECRVTGGDGKPVKISCPADPDFVQLPGEPAYRPPLAPEPHGDRLSAFVFRNWGLVPPAVLARVVGASEGVIASVAADFGLAPNPVVPPEWRRKGYVTILRRNWHLLPYDQLAAVVQMTRKELRRSLVEDDFLFGKLGSLKPACEPLVWSRELAESGREGRRRFRADLESEGVAVFDPAEEPRFKFVHDLAQLPVAAKPADVGARRFDHRLIFPYCADYGDPLADPDASSCSEGLIARLAARGVDALWFHVVLADLTVDPKYPEFGRDSVRRVGALRKLVARAAKHGVKIYLYVNEPRAQPSAFFDVPGRGGMRGTPDRHNGLYNSMCTRAPETLAWLRGALKQLFTAVPGLGGVFTVTMSENKTHCASDFKIDCPRCNGRKIPEFVAEVNRAIVDGVKAGNPAAEIWAFDVAWPDDAATSVVPLLPKECRLIAWSEKLKPFVQAGQTHRVSEYSVSHPGPGPRAVSLWNAARAAGLKTVAKLQVSTSWEISAVPYLPTMDLVAEHAFNLSTSAVDGVMLSWSLGGYPSPNLRLFDAFRVDEKGTGPLLDRLAAELYGADAKDAVRKAWRVYSDAFREYPIEWQTVYYSPVQMGPANPLYAKPSGYAATMVNTPYDDFARWSGGYAQDRAAWTRQMRLVADGFEKGDAAWAEVVECAKGAARDEARRERTIFRAATLHFRTCVDQADFIAARDGNDAEGMRRAAAKELATAKEFLRLVRADSRLGFESSNRYVYVPNDVLEKIVGCRRLAKDAK